MKFLTNAFSIQMLNGNATLSFTRVRAEEVAAADFKSVIGHQDTAAVLSTMLDREIECNRESITFFDGDIIYVAQLIGGRLPEGTTTLPDGYKFEFWKIR